MGLLTSMATSAVSTTGDMASGLVKAGADSFAGLMKMAFGQDAAPLVDPVAGAVGSAADTVSKAVTSGVNNGLVALGNLSVTAGLPGKAQEPNQGQGIF